jgi:hypothetical protein
VISVEEVYHKLPSLQSQIRAAEYRIEVKWTESRKALEARVTDFLAAETIMRQRRGKAYDLRLLVESLSVGEAVQDGYILHMRLCLSQRGTARHDEVSDALGLTGMIGSACRERLFFESAI